jgi:hypothetical protein
MAARQNKVAGSSAWDVEVDPALARDLVPGQVFDVKRSSGWRLRLRLIGVLHARPANAADHGEKGETKETEGQHRFYDYCKSNLHACLPLSHQHCSGNLSISQAPVAIGFLLPQPPWALHSKAKCRVIFRPDNNER